MIHLPRALRPRFWIHLATLATIMLAATFTLLYPQWIEALTGTDPDHGNGTVEWAIAVTISAVAAFSAKATRSEWQRAAGPRSPHPS